MIRVVWRFVKPPVQIAHVIAPNIRDRFFAQRRHDLTSHQTPVHDRRFRFQVYRHINPHEPFGEFRHGDRCYGSLHGRFAALDAVDRRGRALSGLIRRQLTVASEANAFKTRRSAGLHEIDLAARGVDTNPEPGQVPIPE